MRSSFKDVLVRNLREGVGSSIGSTWYETLEEALREALDEAALGEGTWFRRRCSHCR